MRENTEQKNSEYGHFLRSVFDLVKKQRHVPSWQQKQNKDKDECSPEETGMPLIDPKFLQSHVTD